jgi:GntR family transcriptional regulator/MocR family aminotransferase
MQLLILLDRTRRENVTAQLTEQLRQAILRGRLTDGARLPSSRSLADQLGIARNTVTRAYETLVVEGYVASRPAAGIFVTWKSRDDRATSRGKQSNFSAAETLECVPEVDSDLRRLVQNRDGRLLVDFLPNQINSALFPLKMWRRLLQRALSQGAAVNLSSACDPAGLPELRSAIAEHVAVSHGIMADPSRIIVTGGRLEGLNIAARMVLAPSSYAVVEDPCYLGAALAFKAAGAVLRSVPVDEDGLIVDQMIDEAAIVYVTPSHQCPTGVALSEARRKALVSWASGRQCLLIEDDYGGEFRDEETQLPTIAAMAPERTLFIGGFASSLGDGLQLGYLIVPPQYSEHARLAKALLNQGDYWLAQTALAEMIKSGSYASYLMRLRAHYKDCRNSLIAALKAHFGDVAVTGANAGLQLFWQLPPGVPQANIFERHARKSRIGVYSLAATAVHAANVPELARRGIILGFGALDIRHSKKVWQGSLTASTTGSMIDRPRSMNC